MAEARSASRRWVPWLTLAAIVVAAFGVSRSGLRPYFEAWLDVGAFDVVLLLTGTAAVFALNGWVLRRSLLVVGHDFGLWDSVLLATASSLWAYVPAAGLGGKAVLLKKRGGLEYRRFAVAMAASLIVATVVAIVTAEGVLVSRGHWTAQSATLAAALAALGVVFAALLALRPTARERQGRIGRLADDLATGWAAVGRNPTGLAGMSVAHGARTVAQAAVLFVAGRALGLPLDFAAALLLAAMAAITLLVSFTPGGLGIRELLQTVAGTAAGYTAGHSLTVATLTTAAALLLSLTAGAAAGWLLDRRAS